MNCILLPGMDGTGRLFSRLAPVLPSWLKPVVVSYPPERTLGYDELAALVARAIPAGEPFMLVAESFSGPVALRVISQSQADGVVFVASFVSCPIPRLLGVAAKHIRPTAFGVKHFLLGHDAPTDLVAECVEVIRSLDPAVLSHRIRCVLREDCRHLLRQSSTPILYLRATQDRVVSLRSLKQMQAVRPEIEVVEIAAPHFVLQREPERSAAAIADFAGRLGGGLRPGCQQ